MQSLDFGFPPGPRRACAVRIGEGALDALVEDVVARCGETRPCFLVTDSIVGPLHAEPLFRRLVARKVVAHVLTVPAGEAHKTRETKARLEDELVERGAGRDALLVAVGGGVVGDLAGFLAATWHRGVPVLQAPTTLLAMVDAALGGKTAVNLPLGKNLVGAFHQPEGIYADVRTLTTLPEPIYREGLAEVVKSALVADRELFAWLEESAPALFRRAAGTLERAVGSCVRIKGRIVTRDERETGLRAVLNCGHTVAHAVETVADYAIPHGRAVAIGLAVEARLAEKRTGFPPDHRLRLERLLQAFGLPTRVPLELDPDRLIAAARRDKKSRDGLIRCALPARIGQMMPPDRLTEEIPEDALRSALIAAADPGKN